MNEAADWIAFLAVNGYVSVSSYFLACFLNRRDPRGTLLVISSGIIYFTQITVSVLFLGAVPGWLNMTGAIVFHLCASSLILFACRRSFRSLIPFVKDGAVSLLRSRDLFLYGIVAIFLLEAALLAAKIYLLPPHVYDTLTYHLTPAVEWYQRQQMPLRIGTAVTRMNSQALGLSVLCWWFFIFFRHDFLVELPQFLWALLLVPVVVAILREGGVERGWAVKFSVVIFFIPSILLQSVTAKDHVALTVSFLAGLIFLYRFLKRGDASQLLLAGAALGLTMGYKLSGFVYALAGVTMMAAFSLAKGRPRPGRNALRHTAVFMAGALGIALATGGYWYIRNILAYGRLQGSFREARYMINAGGSWTGEIAFRLGVFRDNIMNFIPRVLDLKFLYEPDLAYISGFGPQFLAFGAFGLAVALTGWMVRSYRRDTFNFFVYSALAMQLFYFFLYFSPYNYRLFIFLPAVMIMYAAVILSRRGIVTTPAGAAAVNWMIVVSMFWCFAHMLPPRGTDLSSLRDFISLGKRYRISANYFAGAADARLPYRFIANYVPARENIAYIGHDDSWSYLYYDANWRRRIVYLDRETFFSGGNGGVYRPRPALARYLRENGTRLVSMCANTECYEIAGPDFVKLHDGLYYYTGGGTHESHR